jgi:hypothetical protein
MLVLAAIAALIAWQAFAARHAGAAREGHAVACSSCACLLKNEYFQRTQFQRDAGSRLSEENFPARVCVLLSRGDGGGLRRTPRRHRGADSRPRSALLSLTRSAIFLDEARVS